MKVLIANLGSTSLKYRLYEMGEGEHELLMRGGAERVTDYRTAIQDAFKELREAGYEPVEFDGVGFKTVLGRGLTGCVPGDEACLNALRGFASVAPAHNPPYVAGIEMFAELLPEVARWCLFETAFYQWMPETAKCYGVPATWRDCGVERHGFHGASHKANAERMAELLGRGDVAQRTRDLYVKGPGEMVGSDRNDGGNQPLRVVSCHLGGSSSLTALKDGVAVATSMGFSPQSGLPQNNRVGDLDSMAIAFVCQELGISVEEAREQLNTEAGLLGISELSNDARDLREAAANGDGKAKLALEFLIAEIRRYLGGFMLELGGLDGVVFSGGMGENDSHLRAAVLAGLEDLGVVLDQSLNENLVGEGVISSPQSSCLVQVLEADEELVIAREVQRQLIFSTTTTSHGVVS